MTAIEQAEIVRAEAAAVRAVVEAGAESQGLNFTVANSETGAKYANVSENDFADLYQARKLELRLYFDRTNYSRELILAPSISTFRSYRALVGFDEIGYMPIAEVRDLINSADAMMRDTPDRALLFASNLSLSDAHPWFEMTMPREITAPTEEEQFPPSPAGHLYIGQGGMLIHRVALKDAYAAGHVLFDDHGKPMDYEQCRRFPQMRASWDVSYALNHKPGGAAVIDLIALLTAQRRGATQCSFVYVDSDAEFARAVQLLRANLRGGTVGIGFDVATTTGELSNPSSVTVSERIGAERFHRLVCVWKERKPQVARERLAQIVKAVRDRSEGGPARRLCIDASNERYFAEETADLFMEQIPVQLIISGNTVEPRPPGYSERDGNINYKTYLGDIYAAAVNDGRIALPPDEYLKSDHRMVMKDAGRYLCVPDSMTGAHGDTFDSGKLAEFALTGTQAPFGYDQITDVEANPRTAGFEPQFAEAGERTSRLAYDAAADLAPADASDKRRANSLGAEMAAFSEQEKAAAGVAAQPIFSTAELEQIAFRRFNPYSSLTASTLSAALDAYEAGEIMTLARLVARIAKSDATIITVKQKREEAVSMRPLTTRPLDDSPLAADQAAVLKVFYDNARASHATKRHVVGKVSLLLEQMMESVPFEYAAHHIIWQPNAAQPVKLPSGKTVPGLSANFEYVPLEFFEARTGELRFLGLNNFYNGAPLAPNEWLITTGPGLMFCAAILHYFKRLALHDMVNFSEKFGTPGIVVHTTAQQNTPEGKAAFAYAQALGSNFRGVQYGAPENKTEIVWPQGGANSEGLPMNILTKEIKQDLISMWMGADLSTISRGSGVIGASVQGEDQEKKERRDCERMSQTLNTSVDPIVLRWYFGNNTPILAEAFIDFPENEDRKQLGDSVTMMVGAGAKVPIEPIAKRLNVPLAKKGEDVFEKAVVPNPADSSSKEKKPATNAAVAADPDLETFLGPLAQDFRKAFADDMRPLRSAMEAVLAPDDLAFNSKVAWLREQLNNGSLAREILAAPKSAEPLAEILRKSFEHGYNNPPRPSTAELAATAR